MFEKTTHTRAISHDEAFQEYCRNQKFREMLDSGCYIRIQEKFVLNSPEYVQLNGKDLELTDYAWDNLPECSLLFKAVIRNEDASVAKNFEPPRITRRTHFATAAEGMKWHSHVNDIHKEIHTKFFASFGSKDWRDESINCWDMLNRFFDVLEIQYPNKFIEDTFLGRHYYDRAKNEPARKGSTRPAKEALIAFSLAYDLPLEIVAKFMDKAEYTFNSDLSSKNRCYKYALTGMVGEPMEIKAKWLADNGAPIFSKKEQKEIDSRVSES